MVEDVVLCVKPTTISVLWLFFSCLLLGSLAIEAGTCHNYLSFNINSYKNSTEQVAGQGNNVRQVTPTDSELEPYLKSHTNNFIYSYAYLSLGIRWYQELQLRLFCRQVLLDPWLNQPDSQFWLMQLLKPWPIVSQAHLLFILYGPMLPEGKIIL